MDLAEIDFLAEDEMSTVGPFNPGVPCRVPLWLAVALKKTRKCRILAPDWMDVERLQQLKQSEQDSPFFAEMPSAHYMEMTQSLSFHAADDIARIDEIRVLVKDLWDLRMSKLNKSTHEFLRSGFAYAKVNNLSMMEINHIRRVLGPRLTHLHRLRHGPSNEQQRQMEFLRGRDAQTASTQSSDSATGNSQPSQ